MKALADNLHVASFQKLEREIGPKGPPWLRALRSSGIERFSELGFPTQRDEEWKFTSVEPIARTVFQPVAGCRIDGLRLEGIDRVLPGTSDSVRIVFVDGHYCRELSATRGLPPGVQAGSLAQALQSEPEAIEPYLARRAAFEDRPFAALSTAFIQDGAYVRIPDGVVLPDAIHLVFISLGGGEPTVSHPRNLIVLGSSSQAQVVETYLSWNGGRYLTNAVTEAYCGENSVLDHTKLEKEAPEAFHIATLAAHVERSGSFVSHSVSLGGSIVRNDIDALLDGEGVESILDGLYLAGGEKLVDNHTRIDHAKPHCQSREVYKGILDGSARAVFNGKIHVRQDAQKTDAKQSNKNLLLSGDAVVDTKPELEIFADDVKCTHGATVGQLDEDALFYLRSRGLGLDEARNLLTYAFASEIILRIKAKAVRKQLDDLLHARVAGPEEIPGAFRPGPGRPG